MEQLLKFFKEKQIKTILDIGTGSGQFVEILLQNIQGVEQIVAVDPKEDFFEAVKDNFIGKNVTFMKMGAERLDFEDESFDLVSLSNALHHLPQIEESLSEIKRVVKPDGFIVISELFSDNLNQAQENQKFYHHLKSYVDRLNGNFHHKTWKKKEILELIKENGVRIITNFEYINQKPFVTETEDVNFWVNRLMAFLDSAKDSPEYTKLLPKVDEFRNRIKKDGMQQATNVVVIGEK